MSSIRRTLSTRRRSLRFKVAQAQAWLRHQLLDGPEPLRIVLVSDGRAYTSEQQFAPLSRHLFALGRRYGAVIEELSLEQALATPHFNNCQILGFKLSFSTPTQDAVDITQKLRAKLRGTNARFVYFDGDDDLCVEWPEVLAQVDGWVKKHVFADNAGYERRYLGKSNLTDLVARNHPYSFDDDIIPSSGPLPASGVSKLLVGWNIGLDDKIAELASTAAASQGKARDIDVCCRAFVKPDTWIYPLRGPLIARIEAMKDRFKVLAPTERVSQEQYYDEMYRSRICVSPFGYGELCWRDFEAILCGCLLVKPSMSHLRTYPDIFRAGETYAPVKWDYSDLSDVCTRYLEDEPERLRVVARAQQVLLDALSEESFVDRVGVLLEQLNALPRLQG